MVQLSAQRHAGGQMVGALLSVHRSGVHGSERRFWVRMSGERGPVGLHSPHHAVPQAVARLVAEGRGRHALHQQARKARSSGGGPHQPRVVEAQQGSA